MTIERSAFTPVLHGREGEMRSARDRLARASAGSGSTLLLRGEPGIGKSRIANELARDAREQGFELFSSVADELERHRPFAAISAALGLQGADHPVLRRVAVQLYGEMPPGTVVSQAPELQLAIVDLLVTYLEDVTAQRPLLVVLDDLQWADPSTIMVVRRLIRRSTHLPLLLVGAMRLAPRRPELDVVQTECIDRGGLVMDVAPLDRRAGAEIAREVAGAAASSTLLEAIGDGGGNPLFVIELADGLLSERRDDGDAAEAAGSGVPDSLTSAVRRRLSHLSPDTMTALSVASVLGKRFSAIRLSSITGRSSMELFDVLEEGIAAGVIGQLGDELAFRHDVIRDAVYESIPMALRMSLHRDVARQMAASGAPVESVAEHFAISATPGDREAVDWLRRAARHSTGTAPAAALELLELAKELLPANDPERAEVLAEEILPLLWLGDAGRSEEVGLEAIGGLGHDPSMQATARTWLATVLSYAGRPREVVAQLELALPHLDPPAHVIARADMARAVAQAFDPRAVLEAEAVLRLGEEIGSDYAVCTSLAALASNALLQGDVERAVELGRAAFDRGSQSSDRLTRLRSGWFEYTMALLAADRFTDARDALEEARRSLESDPAPWIIALHHVAVSMSLAEHSWDDALTEAQTAIEVCEESQTHYATPAAWGIIATIQAQRGDRAAADVAAAQARAHSVPGASHLGSSSLALAHVLMGDVAERLKRVSKAVRLMQETGVRHMLRRLAPQAVRLSLEAGDPDIGVLATEMLEETVRDDTPPSIRGAAFVCRGLLRSDADMLLEGVSELRRAERPFELAVACEDAGRLLIADDRHDAATELLMEAADIYERFECHVHMQRVAAMLRSIGVRRGRKGKSARPSDGSVHITPTEAQVLVLVREGLSNPQIGERLFISRRTVATHITHLFQKLGVNTRTALAVVSLEDTTDG